MVAQDSLFPSFKELTQMLITFSLVLVGWIIFRANNIEHAWSYIAGIFDKSLFKSPMYVSMIHDNLIKNIVFVGILVLVEWLQRRREHGLQIMGLIKQRWVRITIYYVVIFLIAMVGAKQAQFIYFQF